VRNRLNARWWPVLELALLVLRCGGLDLPQGRHAVRAFLVNMNSVFERFVRIALEAELRRTGHRINGGEFTLHLDEARAHRLKPDLAVWTGNNCVFVGDCKYKRVTRGLAPEQDLYQSLAYAVTTGLRTVTLIYASDTDLTSTVRIVDGRTTVLVRSINLSAPGPALHAQFTSLAAEIVHGN
jgi:5-methylcytosine-specific restriction enzyme subunit McrC